MIISCLFYQSQITEKFSCDLLFDRVIKICHFCRIMCNVVWASLHTVLLTVTITSQCVSVFTCNQSDKSVLLNLTAARFLVAYNLCWVCDVVLSPWRIADDVINSILDDMFPAETAASDVISLLLDQVMTTFTRRRPRQSYSLTDCLSVCVHRSVKPGKYRVWGMDVISRDFSFPDWGWESPGLIWVPNGVADLLGMRVWLLGWLLTSTSSTSVDTGYRCCYCLQ